MIGLVAAANIMLVTFGSVVAMGLPLVTALFGLGVAMALGEVLRRVVDVPDWAPATAAMVGIGVRAFLPKAEDVKTTHPVLTVRTDAFDAWKVDADWQKDVVADRIRTTYADYLTFPKEESMVVAQRPPAQTYVVAPGVAAAAQTGIRSGLI